MASQQWRRLPNANPYRDSHGDGNRNRNSHGNCDSHGDCDGHGDCDSYGNCDSYGYRDANPHGDPASADAKAAAYAVSTAHAAVVKGLKESESNRELARQLASSLLLGGGALRIMRHAFWSAAVLRRF